MQNFTMLCGGVACREWSVGHDTTAADTVTVGRGEPAFRQDTVGHLCERQGQRNGVFSILLSSISVLAYRCLASYVGKIYLCDTHVAGG
jgi:hypothetical protein